MHELPVFEFLLRILPYLISLGITTSVAVFTFSRRNVPGARSFALVLFLEMLWTVGYMLGMVSSSMVEKAFWDDFQYIGVFSLPGAILAFALVYSGRIKTLANRRLWPLWCLALVSIALVYIHPAPEWVLHSPRLVPAPFGAFDLYVYEYGMALWAVTIYQYSLLAIGFVILSITFVRQKKLPRKQTGIILIGLLIPLVGSVLTLPSVANRDISPFTFALANLIIAMGLFRYRMFNILPVARESVMDLITEPVIIVDAQECILEVNAAAGMLICTPPQTLIGQPMQEAFARLPVLANFLAVQDVASETIVSDCGEVHYFEAHSTALCDDTGQYAGRLLVLHDITRRKQEETALRLSRDTLEENVHQRTAELEQANRQLFAEVEERKQAEQDKTVYSQELEVLYRLAIELAALPARTHITEFIAHKLRDLTNAFAVAIAEYNSQQKQLETQQLFVDPASQQLEEPVLERNALHRVYPVGEDVYRFLTHTPVIHLRTLSEATAQTVPANVASSLQHMFDLENFIGLVITDDGELLATITLILRAGEGIPSVRFLQALTHIITIALRRHKSEQARLESETRFQQMADLLPQVIYECDLQGKLTYINQRALDLFGYDSLPAGLGVLDLIIQSQRHWAFQNMRRLFQGGRYITQEYFLQRRDGSQFPGLIYSSLIQKDNQPVGLRGTLIDISDIKHAEMALRESETKFRTLFEVSADANLLLRDGIFIDCNAAALRLLGAHRSQVVGHRPEDLSPPQQPDRMESAEKSRRYMEQALRIGSVKFEWVYRRPDASDLWVEVLLTRIVLNGKQNLYTTCRDITDRKNVEQDLLRLNRFLRTASRCNLALVRASDQDSLFKEICQALVEEGRYVFVWIGLLGEAQENVIYPVAYFGVEDKTFQSVIAACPKLPLNCVPMLEAIRWQGPIQIDDLTTDPRCHPCHADALSQHLVTEMILPLSYSGEHYGGIAVVSERPDSFGPEEVSVLKEMSGDLSFGIHTLRMRSDRIRALNQLGRLHIELAEAYDATLEGWSRALELRERETAGHSRRVVELTLNLARELGIGSDELVNIRWGAYLHDIGKIGIPDAILLKPGPLTEAEWQIMRQHPIYAYNLLSPIAFLRNAIDIPYLHHERWDGSGYPLGLKGEDIPLPARIFAVVDVWDALRFERPYRTGWAEEATLEYIRQQSDIQFDRRVVEAFINLLQRSPL